MKMGWAGSGLGAQGQGIETPISGGEVRDRQDQYKGVGISLSDPYENFRKNKGAAFIHRMRSRDHDRKKYVQILIRCHCIDQLINIKFGFIFVAGLKINQIQMPKKKLQTIEIHDTNYGTHFISLAVEIHLISYIYFIMLTMT